MAMRPSLPLPPILRVPDFLIFLCPWSFCDACQVPVERLPQPLEVGGRYLRRVPCGGKVIGPSDHTAKLINLPAENVYMAYLKLCAELVAKEETCCIFSQPAGRTFWGAISTPIRG